jgi:hypothetical protein
MKLKLLLRTTCLTAYYDQWNEWLFLDWEGELTLPLVQESCAALAPLFLHYTYARVLNNNERVHSIDWNITGWVVANLLPHLTSAGIEYVAWVHSYSLPGQHMVQTILAWLASPRLNGFTHTVDAVSWLQQRKPVQLSANLPRSLATRAALTQDLNKLLRHVEANRQNIQPA